MKDLAAEIPDADLLLELEPEELAGKLLFVLRRRLANGARSVHLGNALNEVIGHFGNDAPWPVQRAEPIKVAITEAWYWLIAQGMLIPTPDGNGPNGFSIVSRRGHAFEDERAFAAHQISRLLPRTSCTRASLIWFGRRLFAASTTARSSRP